jgi:hypothetical protein
MPLWLIIVLASLVVDAIVLGLVFRLRNARLRRMAEHREQIAGRVVLDTGMAKATLRWRGFAAPGRRTGVGVSLGRGQLVLTDRALVRIGLTYALVGSRTAVAEIPLAELHRIAASDDNGALLLQTDEPIGATGHSSVRIVVENVAEWLRALREAGAR